jgi:phosphoglycolate phosphatase
VPDVTRTLLVDLDGTLVDSVPDIAAALNRLGLAPPFADAEVTQMIGDGLGALLARACTARGQVLTPELSEAFMADYHAHAADQTRVYEGVLPTLRNMVVDGWCIAVCTNKPEDIARSILRKLGFSGLIAAIGGGDSFPVRKPDPGHLVATLQSADGTLEQAVMVGDHFNDVTAARAAGIPCIFAGWGYGPITMSAGASAIAMNFADVHGLAARLLVRQEDE